LTRKEVFDEHHVGRSYIEKNYREALMALENERKITTDPPAAKRKKNTFAETVSVSFPKRKKKA
jgi:hypothetical protein